MGTPLPQRTATAVISAVLSECTTICASLERTLMKDVSLL